METNVTIAIISLIGTLLSTIGLGYLQLKQARKSASAEIKQREIETSPEIISAIREANKQEFDIMRELNSDLKKRVAELEDSVEKYKNLYEELKTLYEELENKYNSLISEKGKEK